MMKILKVINIVIAVLLTGLVIGGFIVWSNGLYNGVEETELLVFEQIGIILLGLVLTTGIWIIAVLIWQTFD